MPQLLFLIKKMQHFIRDKRYATWEVGRYKTVYNSINLFETAETKTSLHDNLDEGTFSASAVNNSIDKN
ncbi:hypothetical protein acsn021_12550 [Anaerocolumna cellulosilytica]|uniref:Uncharacterized protein n=1 Tax=Anaerocolumna cellulosilytica TaxID=433286 RepID=A0A6S6QVJ3_9FIRM|nr:hypothetical protein acsn021_12550 [Anaerocolumna cellulosilytica]